ncbi:hypothetical protein HG536_0A00900 [Torulaspora globosa]|uniref:Nucleolar protein 19 n=1 Tax=Torulaspora globosa TaxID=48254 RepID=A0A7G3Z9T7_9SACH|nr:uncharacterized protein HG536_0A00900 [Torulaspora globosa]QLL30273.1 hypothetical protein HG536_0A00900 [Torulaspora globosa]
MSRSKEIQEKLDLQAKLQRSFGRNTKRVLSWLAIKDTEEPVDTTELNNSKATFFTLPVMQTGSGLNLNPVASTSENRDDIHTVGEFIQSEKKVSSLSKKRRPHHSTQSSGIHRISKDDTRAMVALKRKMRQNQREAARRKTQPAAASANERNGHDGESEDEDDDRPVQKASKKSFGLLFSGGKKAKR